MTEYQIQAPTRRCAATGRALQPGERFYTVLLDEDGRFVRQDYAAEAWQGPPANAFSFWAGRVPATDEKARPRIDEELLLECLQRLEAQTEPNRISFRYVIALLLMRRKRLRFEEARTVGEQEVLVLGCTRSRQTFEVVNPCLTEEAMATAQEDVFKVLGWD